MFANQSEERDNSNKLLYPKTYEIWLLSTNGKSSKRQQDYLDGNFFQYVVVEYAKNGSYKTEFCEMIDLLIRKVITHKNYIGYDADIKHELYSVAMDKIFKYTIAGYNSSKGTAFVFFTSAITNAFKEVLKDYYKTKKIAKRLLTIRQSDAVAYNYESADISEIEDQIKKSLVYFEDDDIIDIKREWNDFYNQINEKYPLTRLKLLEDPNTPKFKRKYITYDHIILLSDISVVEDIDDVSDYFSDILDDEDEPELKAKKGVVVELFDLRTTNESNGTRPNELMSRAIIARKNGYQYFGVFSDQWTVAPEVIKMKLDQLVEYTRLELSESQGRDLQFDYIVKDDLSDDNLHPAIFWGLSEDRTTRYVLNQNIESYISWLDSVKNPTRVYGFGRLKS
jgi:hypothetical protein